MHMHSARPMKFVFAALVASLMFAATTAYAFLSNRDSPVGYWKTIDDETGDAKSIVKIYEVEGKFYGRIDRLLKDPTAICTECEGEDKDKPIQLTHAVLNANDVEACERFAVETLGFKVSDRTAHMRFVRCNRKHHALAYAKSDLASLNHVAFEMPSLDAVMRGIARLREAGYEPVWGPGRHGPGNNVFGYFIAPYGGVIEYTAEVSEVGDDYKVGTPEDWKWPPGRIDHWGLSKKDTAKTGPAERVFRFTAP